MAGLEFVDSHVHFWDLGHPDLRWSHLEPGFIHPILGDKIQPLGQSNYLVDDFLTEIRGSNVTKAIHVQAALGSDDPVMETKWLQAAADRTGFPQGIVGEANLRDPNVGEVLERHCDYANMRGIRDFSYGDYLVEPDFHRGFSLLAEFNLVASLDVKWRDMAKLRDLAFRHPGVVIVLDHAGFPEERTPEYFANWKRGMETIAEADNIICKISGLGMCDNNWTVDSIRPWVHHCIETFGPSRSLFATNWPVDKLWSSYDAVVRAYGELISSYSRDEQVAMFSENAERLYQI